MAGTELKLPNIALEVMSAPQVTEAVYDRAQEIDIDYYRRTLFHMVSDEGLERFTSPVLLGHTSRVVWDYPELQPSRSYRKNAQVVLAWEADARDQQEPDPQGLLAYAYTTSDTSGLLHEFKRLIPKTNWLWLRGAPYTEELEKSGFAPNVIRGMLALATHPEVAGSRNRPSSAFPWVGVHVPSSEVEVPHLDEGILIQALEGSTFNPRITVSRSGDFIPLTERVLPFAGTSEPMYRVDQLRYTSTVGKVHDHLMAFESIARVVGEALEENRVQGRN